MARTYREDLNVETTPKLDAHVQTVQIDVEDAATNGCVEVPRLYRYVALACIISLPLGTNWTQSSVGPLKNTLRKEWDISNAQFGVISSADAFVNTVFPILGGLILDCLIAAGSTINNMWRLLVGGHVLMGFGIAVLDSAQQKFFYHWFGASGLAFAFGIENAFSSVTSLAAGMTAIPIRDSTGWYGWSFWIPTVLCGFSLLVNIAYVGFERIIVPKQYRFMPERVTALHTAGSDTRQRIFSWRTLLQLPWCYLMLPATQLLQSGAAGGFGASATDLISMKGFEEAVAGYLATAQRILPIVLSPVVGWLIDLYGHRFHYVAFAPILWIIANTLIGFTNVHPLVALAKLGTAFGLWRAFNNSGSTIMDVVFGALQDDTADMGYDKVLKLSIGLKAWAFALGLFYILIDDSSRAAPSDKAGN
ncbi:hypothetical protein MBLNU13_g05246t2 [Cladosporium sp. NU13]